MTVQVPAERVDDAVQQRLQSLTRSTKIDGYRPGKVPLRVIQRRFGVQVRQEILGEVIEDSFREAILEQELKPAGMPSIDAKVTDSGKDLEYAATFEIYPEVLIEGLEDVEVESVSATVHDADVERMLDNLRKQRASWIVVERAAELGDQVTIDFQGTRDGVVFSGGSAQDFEIELGSGRFIPGFEDQLVGVAAGEEKTFALNFPADYPEASLAGAEAEFKVELKQVKQIELPALDEAFAQSFGAKDASIEGLQAEVRGNMDRELQAMQRNKLKQAVVEALAQHVQFELPTALINQEVARIKQQLVQQSGNPDLDLDKLPDEGFIDEASRRVRHGLIIGSVITQNQLQADVEAVRAAVEKLAAPYDDPAQVINYYYSNPQLLKGIEESVLEDAAIDWVLDRVKLTQLEQDFETLMNPVAKAPPV